MYIKYWGSWLDIFSTVALCLILPWIHAMAAADFEKCEIYPSFVIPGISAGNLENTVWKYPLYT